MSFKKIEKLLFVVILLIGAYWRFFKLDWGEGFFFHPDEYHIAGSVGQLQFPEQMNPNLFSYGSLIVYQIFFTIQALKALQIHFLDLNPFLIGRFYSALYSSLTLIPVYLLSKRLSQKKFVPLLAVLMTALLPGLIQQAHFATPEAILTFWLFLSLYLIIRFTEKKQLGFLYLASGCLGFGIGTKVTALTLLPTLLAAPWIGLKIRLPRKSIFKTKSLLQKFFRLLTKVIKFSLLPLLIIILSFALVFPYGILKWENLRGTTTYESGVGRGEPLVFYTRQFIGTLPLIFQLEKILPYTLGPGVLLLGIVGFLLLVKKAFKNGKFFLIVLAFSGWFFPNAWFFAKWTRFLSPTFPYFCLFSAFLLNQLKKPLLKITIGGLLIINFIWSGMFLAVYLRPDVRITATDWLNQYLPPQSYLLSEAGNMIEAPLSGNFPRKNFDFYNLDENPKLPSELALELEKTDYFIVQSRRIFANHLPQPNRFPITSRLYTLLFNGQLGFVPVKEFYSFPGFKILGREIAVNDEMTEETWTVFDHPVIRVYQKVKPYSSTDYQRLLGI